MTILKRSKDRKVANSLTPSGGVRIANSFGLPAGKAFSCPNATSVCESICYAGRLEKVYKGVAANLLHNWNALKDATYAEMYDMLSVMIDDFRKDCDKHNAPKAFRIHWDGDFFNNDYANAWHDVILFNDDIQFWVYTRVPMAAIILSDVPNLTLYFSTDSDNVETAIALNESHGIRLAFLGQTFMTAKQLGAGIRSAICPEQRKQIPLNGACVACGICVKGTNNIAFSISKK